MTLISLPRNREFVTDAVAFIRRLYIPPQLMANAGFHQSGPEPGLLWRRHRTPAEFPPDQFELGAVAALGVLPQHFDAAPGNREGAVLYRIGQKLVQNH